MPTASPQDFFTPLAGLASITGAERRRQPLQHVTRLPALLPIVGALVVLCGIGSASAQSFTIDNTASTTARTLGAGAGQTGTVTATGSLTVSGGTTAIAVSGNDATLNNLGTIKQTGNGRVVRSANATVSNLTITNGSLTNSTARMESAGEDVIQMRGAGSSATVNNYGSLVARGGQAVDFNDIKTGANTVSNYAGALIQSAEADAVRPGVNGVVNNYGRIIATTTAGDNSDGIDIQSNTGVRINNFATGVIQGGRSGIVGEQANASASFAATINNYAGGVIQGDNGSGINFDGINNRQQITIDNAGSIIGNGVSRDGDGIDVDGMVYITNNGLIRSVNSFSADADGLAFSEGISVGGGTIINAGTIEGLVGAGNGNAVGRGITLVGNDTAGGTREPIYGDTTVINNAGGLIRGQSDSAIYVGGPASGYTVTITNRAGATIQGGGSAAAIQTGFDNDTLTNGGKIDGEVSGRAIDMGAGNNTLRIVGGQAVILGNVNGGTGGQNVMTIDPGAGNSFAYAGSLSNFNDVQIQSGTVTLSGVSTYSGTTTVNSTGTVVLDGAGRLSSASSLALNGGRLEIANAAGSNAQTFASFSLGASSVIDLNGASLTFNSLGTIANGATLSFIDYLSSGEGYAFRLLGDLTTDANFAALLGGTTIDGMASTYRFDGTYTQVTAVPEPTSAALLLAGLGLMGAATRRRKAAPTTV